MIKHRFFEFASWNRDDEFREISGVGFWFRICGWGLWFAKRPLTFSERNGFRKVRRLPYGWRWGYLKRGVSGVY